MKEIETSCHGSFDPHSMREHRLLWEASKTPEKPPVPAEKPELKEEIKKLEDARQKALERQVKEFMSGDGKLGSDEIRQIHNEIFRVLVTESKLDAAEVNEQLAEVTSHKTMLRLAFDAGLISPDALVNIGRQIERRRAEKMKPKREPKREPGEEGAEPETILWSARDRSVALRSVVKEISYTKRRIQSARRNNSQRQQAVRDLWELQELHAKMKQLPYAKAPRPLPAPRTPTGEVIDAGGYTARERRAMMLQDREKRKERERVLREKYVSELPGRADRGELSIMEIHQFVNSHPLYSNVPVSARAGLIRELIRHKRNKETQRAWDVELGINGSKKYTTVSYRPRGGFRTRTELARNVTRAESIGHALEARAFKDNRELYRAIGGEKSDNIYMNPDTGVTWIKVDGRLIACLGAHTEKRYSRPRRVYTIADYRTGRRECKRYYDIEDVRRVVANMLTKPPKSAREAEAYARGIEAPKRKILHTVSVPVYPIGSAGDRFTIMIPNDLMEFFDADLQVIYNPHQNRYTSTMCTTSRAKFAVENEAGIFVQRVFGTEGRVIGARVHFTKQSMEHPYVVNGQETPVHKDRKPELPTVVRSSPEAFKVKRYDFDKLWGPRGQPGRILVACRDNMSLSFDVSKMAVGEQRDADYGISIKRTHPKRIEIYFFESGVYHVRPVERKLGQTFRKPEEIYVPPPKPKDVAMHNFTKVLTELLETGEVSNVEMDNLRYADDPQGDALLKELRADKKVDSALLDRVEKRRKELAKLIETKETTKKKKEPKEEPEEKEEPTPPAQKKTPKRPPSVPKPAPAPAPRVPEKNVFEEKAKTGNLNEYTKLTPEQWDYVLDSNPASLVLGGLKTLDVSIAKRIAKSNVRSVNLDGLESFNEQLAGALVLKSNKRELLRIRVKNLDEKIARELAKFQGEHLLITGYPEPKDDVATILFPLFEKKKLEVRLLAPMLFKALEEEKKKRAQAAAEKEKREKATPFVLKAEKILRNASANENEIKNAIGQLNKAKNISDHFGIDLFLARAYCRAGRMEKGINSYQELIKKQPRNHAFLNEFAWLVITHPDVRRSRDIFNLAKEMAEKAVALDPGNANYMDTLAAWYASNGTYDKAMEWVDKAIEQATDEQKNEILERRALYERGVAYKET